jgi:hypothetical protein
VETTTKKRGLAIVSTAAVRGLGLRDPSSQSTGRPCSRRTDRAVRDRSAALPDARLQSGDINDVVQTAIGGMNIGETVEGRERYPINIRYARRELRDDPEADSTCAKEVVIPLEGQKIEKSCR